MLDVTSLDIDLLFPSREMTVCCMCLRPRFMATADKMGNHMHGTTKAY